MVSLFIIVIWVLSLMGRSNGKCPAGCVCDVNKDARQRVTCKQGGLTKIPTLHMNTDIQILIVTAPSNNHNVLTLGRFFLDFHQLEEIRITYSNLPAIGDRSFWPGKRLRILDLSHNNISIIRDQDFNGLENLQILDLSYNNIDKTPSAPFRFLSSLTTLFLTKNRLRTLVPRFFYMLMRLEKLDLSGNPLKEIDPDNLKDVRPLKRLHLSKCLLTRLHSLIYQHLPNLEELDLRDNRFTFFSPEEFRHLRRLKFLHLDGNNLTIIGEKTFDGHNLRHLGLSRNQIFKFSKCAFCNFSVQQLDLSYNHLHSLSMDVLSPVAHSLESLDLGFNSVPSEDLELSISPLYKLKKLSVPGMGLSEFSDDAFFNNGELRTLDLSYNLFFNFSYRTLLPLRHLGELDLSYNQFESLDTLLLEQFQNMTTLSVLHLHSNPWSCHRCSVLPLLTWIRTSPLYSSTCDMNSQSSSCMRCDTPPVLEGRALHSLKREDLEPCGSSVPQSRVLVASSNVGIIVSIAILVLLVAVIIISVLVYRQQGAVYYTHEGESNSSSGPIDWSNANGHGCSEDKRRAFFVTLDRIDELAEEKITGKVNIS